MKDKINITLNIAGEILELRIPRDEEEILRNATLEINRVWNSWKSVFKDSSSAQVLARITLLFARGFLAQKAANESVDTLLSSLDKELDDLLAES
ncbi:MAG: cell division protein ZapA [Paramuribaculum sp.]|nr:cell division protein ZapA [Paramuribaculum sp.]